MIEIIFLALAGLVALGFLIVISRRKQMPALLRGILLIGAVAIVVYVGWILFSIVTVNPGGR